jgi:hypothetical protein
MHVRIALVAFASLASVSFAHAEFRLLDDQPLLAAAEAAPTSAPVQRQPFSKDSWAADFCGSYITHIRWSEDYFTTGSAGINYYFFDNVSFGLRLSGYLIDQPNDDGTAGSFDVHGRIHLLKIDRFTLYFDGGGSRAWSNTAVPEGGTTYNYIGRVGGGVTYHLFDNMHLMGGARYFHLSNGDVHGRINNPSFDGIESYIGVMLTF